MLPFCAVRCSSTHRFNKFAHPFKIKVNALAVIIKINRALFFNAKTGCRCYCIYIRTKEQKLPAGFFLRFNKLFYLRCRIMPAGIFQTIRSNYNQCMFRHIFVTYIFMNAFYMLNSFANRIQKCSTAANIIFFLC